MTDSSHSLTRRSVLRGLAVGGGVTAAGLTPVTDVLPVLGGQSASAQAPGRLVLVFLRGGMDGLSACVPYTETDYYTARPTIAVPDTVVIDLDGQFGLHPALAPLHPLYQQGRLALVHAAGSPSPNRSHFEAQARLEQGSGGGPTNGDGWLARHLSNTSGAPGAAFRAVALGARPPASLTGYSEALTVASLADFGLAGASGLMSSLTTTVRLFHHGDTPGDVVGTALHDAFDVVAGLSVPTPPSDPIEAMFSDAAVLLDASLGIEVLTLDIGDWDTHVQMGTHTSGWMADLLSGLATSLASFQAQLDSDGQSDVTTVVMSDFGRRVAENGGGGTDHGKGQLMMAMGSGINGGQVITNSWPTLAPGSLDDGDLPVTTDFRDVLGEVLGDILGNSSPGSSFPGHTLQSVGLTV